PVDLATLAGAGPGLPGHVPDAGLALRPAQRDGDVLPVVRHLRLLHQRAVQGRHLGAVDQQLLVAAAAQLAPQDTGAPREDDLVGADPVPPAGVVDDLGRVLAVGG